MTDKKTGGPAFPVPNDANVNGQEGMQLRDYFAAKAMQAMIANDWPMHDGSSMGYLTESAYRTADAMLEAREK